MPNQVDNVEARDDLDAEPSSGPISICLIMDSCGLWIVDVAMDRGVRCEPLVVVVCIEIMKRGTHDLSLSEDDPTAVRHLISKDRVIV